MKCAMTLLFLNSLLLSGCVSDRAIYTEYGKLDCGADTPPPVEILVDATEPWPTVINFEFDKSHATGDQQQKLMAAVSILQNNPSLNLAVIGSADSVGQNAYNNTLASKRATNVTDYFKQQGIAASRIVTLSSGSREQFVVSNNKQTNLVNRRVQLILLDSDFNPVGLQYKTAIDHLSAQ
ncbi:Outer membrane lipoprotein Omp16 precursor [Photobacterium malacitanum]|uniref:Outer membrane lipoprotein Omp16 n=2 Tax=Photobacterium malacitanum TaxID=2204294 RepID=A0A1Y6MIQ9_9GAMM|nr:Outer membrane lipoprotein Omp16 precursor [Photobacterium malacitanum]